MSVECHVKSFLPEFFYSMEYLLLQCSIYYCLNYCCPSLLQRCFFLVILKQIRNEWGFVPFVFWSAYFSASVFSLWNDTMKDVLVFGFFSPNSTCLLYNDFLICTLPKYSYWKEREKLLGMSCYAKLRIISS